MPPQVEFDEDKPGYTVVPRSASGFGTPAPSAFSGNQPKMVRWLINKNIVKSPAAAQGMLIAFIVVNLAITYIVIKYFIA